jgi:hypothetical protein
MMQKYNIIWKKLPQKAIFPYSKRNLLCYLHADVVGVEKPPQRSRKALRRFSL